MKIHLMCTKVLYNFDNLVFYIKVNSDGELFTFFTFFVSHLTSVISQIMWASPWPINRGFHHCKSHTKNKQEKNYKLLV